MTSQNGPMSALVHAYSAPRRWTNADILGVPLTDDDEDAPMPIRKKKCQEIKLKRNEDGYPVLLSLEQINEHDLLCKKKLIGTFIGDIYGL
jgi:hypothetical protein